MFEYTDTQTAELFAWLTFFVFLMLAGAVGCAIHGLHREYRQYLEYRKTHARWREICQEDGK